MLCHLYLREGIVYVPTVGQADIGFYIDVDPVTVLAATDTEALRQTIRRAIDNGNPKIPAPTSPTDYSKPILLNYAKVRSWKAFESKAEGWKIYEKKGVYQIGRIIKNQSAGSENDSMEVETLPSDAGVDDTIQRILALVQSTFDRYQVKNKSDKSVKNGNEVAK